MIKGYQITAPHFVAGLDVRKDFCILAAPIIKYMRGWPFQRVRSYCQTKNWRILEVDKERKDR